MSEKISLFRTSMELLSFNIVEMVSPLVFFPEKKPSGVK
jgi:hypothetical protein